MAIEIRPLTAAIGAEIYNIDLANVSDSDIDDLHKAWMDWKVLFFRDQHITDEEHVAFGRRFGELEIHPFAPSAEGHPELLVITSSPERPYAASNWHSDVTWREEPSMGSILRAVELPPVGGDTCFANAALAYDRLSDEWKERVDDLVAVHDFTNVFGSRLSAEERAEKQREYPPARHPVIRTHPETGARLIYTNRSFVSEIEGLSAAETREIVHHLEMAIRDPSVQCRFRWEMGSFAMWDNRCVQHFATNDFWPQRRQVQRVTMKGDRPY